MFCIAAFLVLLVLGAFSARYRGYLRRAWGCTVRRVTFRPCDTSFSQDIKDNLLAPVAARRPGLVRPAAIAIEVAALLIIVTTMLSAYVVAKGALNLWVYGTCDKANAEGCALGAQSCSIGALEPTFLDKVVALDVVGAIGGEVADVAETIGAIPDRLRTWDAAEYLPPNVTWRTGFDPARPTALEIVDPGCSVCAKLAANIREAGFADRYNLAYIAYPIPVLDGTKFPNSGLVVRYLEALRLHPVAGAEVPLDWQLLERILSGTDPSGKPWQIVVNGAAPEEATALLQGWLGEFGLDEAGIEAIVAEADSERVASIIEANQAVVRETIGTRKIPTVIFDGSRHDGLVDVDGLR
ncbi:MAG: DsbA family protein [Candidatus Limnocylindrales bacterium]